jgi:hypothetical protein
MGWFSSVVNAVTGVAKAVVNVVKTIVRTVVKIVIDIVYRIIDGVLAIFNIQKRMRIQVMILRDENGVPVIPENDPDLIAAVESIKTTFKDKCNVKVTSYGKPAIQVISKPAPATALDTDCQGSSSFWREFGKAGNYFTGQIAGWNVIPISLRFPITIFVVRAINGKIGCSLGILTDYVTVDPTGARSQSHAISHEMGHCCGLAPFNLHDSSMKNLMYKSVPRGNDLSGWQRFWVRGSRHCTFW